MQTLKNLRSERGLSVSDLAKRSGLSRGDCEVMVGCPRVEQI
jgi:hypothetical protein